LEGREGEVLVKELEVSKTIGVVGDPRNVDKSRDVDSRNVLQDSR
jgi:hypothetical protein